MEAELAKLVERARAGVEVIVTTPDDHKAKLVAINTAAEPEVANTPRRLGLLRGQLSLAQHWNSDKVNEEIARRFNDGDVYPR